MNAAHLHLLFTHFPLVGFGIALLVNIYGMFRKNPEIIKLNFWLYILVGISALAAYLTGNGAEEIMKTYPGVTEDITELHEHFALVFLIGALLTACVSLYGLYLSTRKESNLKKINTITLVLAVIVCFFALETATTGGNIRHSEIQSGPYHEMKK